ncbi:MAG TPA: hypothetical protein VK718_01925 [Ferruginibacter sp.]|jgi:hypothetical protein|nr:hypothetical protein [Ferruginibacter sp.]
MFKKICQIVFVIILLDILFDPSINDLKNGVRYFFPNAFNTIEAQPDSQYHSFTIPESNQSTFDSTAILQGIDSIQSTP